MNVVCTRADSALGEGGGEASVATDALRRLRRFRPRQRRASQRGVHQPLVIREDETTTTRERERERERETMHDVHDIPMYDSSRVEE